MFSFGDVIRLLQFSKSIRCVTTRALQCVSGERGHCSLYWKGLIAVSDAQKCSVLLQDAAVPSIVDQSVNHAEPAVWCTGTVSISLLHSPMRNSKNWQSECM